MRRILVLAILIVSLASLGQAQDDWHTYPFRDLRTLVGGEQDLYRNSGGKAEMVISAKPFPSKTRVTFAGKKRGLSEYGKTFVKLWAESRNAPEGAADQLTEEFLFLERGTEYWLPVLKNTARGISQNLREGEEVVIYYFYLGGFDPTALRNKSESKDKPEPESAGMRWMLAVERVERPGAGFPLMSVEDLLVKNQPDDLAGNWVPAQQIKAKVKAEFIGEFREVSGSRMELRNAWFEKQGAPAAAQLMQTEGLFKIENKAYWVLLRDRTREHLVDYVKKGDVVFLNTILAGGFRNSKTVEWVLMSGEYSTF